MPLDAPFNYQQEGNILSCMCLTHRKCDLLPFNQKSLLPWIPLKSSQEDVCRGIQLWEKDAVNNNERGKSTDPRRDGRSHWRRTIPYDQATFSILTSNHVHLLLLLLLYSSNLTNTLMGSNSLWSGNFSILHRWITQNMILKNKKLKVFFRSTSFFYIGSNRSLLHL